MEAKLNKMDSRPEILEVSEDASVDEAIPIDHRKEKRTEAQEEKMSKYIDNIDTYETRKTFIQQNGGQSMKLQMKLISKVLKFPQMTLLKNVKIIQTKHMI